MPRKIAAETDPGLPGRFRHARTVAGKTLQQVADDAGTTIDMVCRYEQGRAMPRAHRLPKLAAALGVTTGYLVGEEEHADPIAAAVRRIVDGAPPLTDEQIDELRRALAVA